MLECGSTRETTRTVLLPTSLGALHRSMWTHQPMCTKSFHTACPWLSLWPHFRHRMYTMGVFLCWEGGPREEVYTGPGGRIMAIGQGIQGSQGSRAWLASAECRLHVGRFLWPQVSPPHWSGEEGMFDQGDPKSGPGQGFSCSGLKMEMDPDAPVCK